jgi:hypothetical protein
MTKKPKRHIEDILREDPEEREKEKKAFEQLERFIKEFDRRPLKEEKREKEE